jgi:hypothetical protein
VQELSNNFADPKALLLDLPLGLWLLTQRQFGSRVPLPCKRERIAIHGIAPIVDCPRTACECQELLKILHTPPPAALGVSFETGRNTTSGVIYGAFLWPESS